MIKEYNKLVRDKIPEIVKAAGEKPITTILLDDKAYSEALKEKMREEIEELIKAKEPAKIVEELIDIQELIDALREHMRISEDFFMICQEKKAEEKGRFKKRIFLIRTEAD